MDELGSGMRCATLGPRAASTSVFVPDAPPGGGVPLFLVPALGLDGRSFSRLAPLVSERPLVAWNLPNALPREGLRGLARFALEHAGRAGLGGRIVVGGTSLGGIVALAAALEAPDRVAGLVLVSTAAAWEELGLLIRSARLLYPLLPRRGFNRRFARVLLPRRLDGRGGSPDHAALRLQMEHRSKDYAGAILDAVRGFDLRPRLAEIRVPTLVIHTLRDRCVPHRAAETLARGIAGARLATLDGGGHVPHVFRPQECRAALAPFLAEIDRREGRA